MTDADILDEADSYAALELADLNLDGYDEDDFDDMDDFEEDGFDDLDELDELDEWDELDDMDELDEWDALGMDDFDEMDALGFDGLDEWDDADDYDYDAASRLYLPSAPRIVSGPTAAALASMLNPAVMDSLDADEADAFFRRIGGFLKRAARGVTRGVRRVGRGIARGVKRVAKTVGPALKRFGRMAAPLLKRALPMIQKVAGMAGPWGRLVSAGIGGVRGLMSGKGLKGALQGAVTGLIPGGAGSMVAGLLRADGLDDDAALDALADMTDAGEVDPAVALPLGAGLAARVIARRGIGAAQQRRGTASSRVRGAAAPVRQAHRVMLNVARRLGGPVGRRLRLLRTIARSAAGRVARSASTPKAAARATPRAAATAARKVANVAARRPQLAKRSPVVAKRRTQMRRKILRQVPVSSLFKGYVETPSPS